MTLAEILAANVEYLKINNIEKSMGLTKTALVRIIARKEIPEKHIEKVEKWWNEWVMSLIYWGGKPVFTDADKKETNKAAGEPIKIAITEKDHYNPNSEIEKQITAINAEKIPKERDTMLGRHSWKHEQQKRISELQKQLK